ncbi:MAG: hypothetical protein FWG69_00790 [Oscillospiraceae bacterium]|nr:hypothetical protein [Oscillospiraceae bacterium]
MKKEISILLCIMMCIFITTSCADRTSDGSSPSEISGGSIPDEGPIPNQEQYHTKTHEEDWAVVEYIFATGMPDENIQIKLNENLEEFFLSGIRDDGAAETYTYGTASYYVAGGRFLSVVKNFDIYNNEHPVNGSTGPAQRYKGAETFDLTTGERAEKLVFGGAAYTMANAFDHFSQVYPDAGDTEARAGFHNYVQSNDFIFNYYLTETNLAIYLPNISGDDYFVYEAPYSMIGEMLSPELAEAVKPRG